MMEDRYYHIIKKLEEARESGDKRKIKLWRNKLEKWQEEYGAYAPVTSKTVHLYD